MAKQLFRACRDMRYKSGTVAPGTLVWLDKPEETMDKLLRLQVIAPVRLPPFEALPGWEGRGLHLEMEGIEGIEEFLSRDPTDLAELLEENIETIESWKRELMMWLSGVPTALEATPAGAGMREANHATDDECCECPGLQDQT